MEVILEYGISVLKSNGRLLEYVRNQTPELCLTAVKQNGIALHYVKEQTPEICLAAVQQDGWAIMYVKDKTHEICLAAVKQNGNTLSYVKEQTPEICLAAIQQNHNAIQFVKINQLIKYANSDLGVIENYLLTVSYDFELVKKLQEYNYAFSRQGILNSIQFKVVIPHIHQYGYNLNDKEFMDKFRKHNFYPESYNLDI